MDFSNISRQLNEGRESTEVAVDSSEKAQQGSQKQIEGTRARRETQKSHMSQQGRTPVKSDISYASEENRTEREHLKMLESAGSNWRQELNEAMGPDPEGNHPFVDVMPFMNQKAQEAKKQMKAAAMAQGEGGKIAKMAEENLMEGPRREEARKRKKSMDTRKAKRQELEFLKTHAKGMKAGIFNSYEPEGDELTELNRLEKEQGKKSGGSSDPAYRIVAKQMRDMQGTPKGQQKKQRGKKPPVAGQYGGGTSPAQRLAMKKKRKQDSIDMQSSRFD